MPLAGIEPLIDISWSEFTVTLAASATLMTHVPEAAVTEDPVMLEPVAISITLDPVPITKVPVAAKPATESVSLPVPNVTD